MPVTYEARVRFPLMAPLNSSMPSTPNIGGPLTAAPQYKVSESRQAGIRPRAEEPNIGGPLKLKQEYEMVAAKQQRSLGSQQEAGTAISTKTDVL